MSRAFNCDLCVQHDITKIIELLGIEYGIETGTFKAETTLFFADLLKIVKTIDISDINASIYREIGNERNNIIFFQGDSGKLLQDMIVDIPNDKPILFYLDAHWNEYWPLLDELKIIGQYFKDNAVIVIDDFKVPNRLLGFDKYGYISNDLNFVKESLDQCGDLFIFFNDHTKVVDNIDRNRGTAGKLYAIPKKYADLIMPYIQEQDGYFYSITKL